MDLFQIWATDEFDKVFFHREPTVPLIGACDQFGMKVRHYEMCIACVEDRWVETWQLSILIRKFFEKSKASQLLLEGFRYCVIFLDCHSPLSPFT